MLVDPFTILAQLVNFGLLIWLLRRFLYGPVTRAMRAREERVRAETEEARRLRDDAAAEGERYRELVSELEAEREARLADMQADFETLRREQIHATRAEIETMRERWRHALEQEQDTFFRELRRRVGHESLTVLRQAFRDLADTEVEDRLVGRFAERLRTLAPADRERIQEAARDGGGRRLLVRTAFPLSDARRAAVRQAVEAVAGGEGEVRFETDPELVAGVELRIGGVKVAWTLDDYLRSLEEALHETLAAQVAAEPGRAGA